jgi:hypothetical protein
LQEPLEAVQAVWMVLPRPAPEQAPEFRWKVP